MHIVALEHEPTSQRGGQEVSFLDVCRGLADRGHHISLLYTKEGDLFTQYRSFCSQTLKVTGYAISRKSITKSCLNLPIDIIKALCLINTNEPTIIYSNQYQDTPFGAVLSKISNVPFICHLRIPPPKFEVNFQRKIAMKSVQKFIAVSHQTQFEWIQKGIPASDINIVHNGINVHRFMPTLDRASLKKQQNIPEDVKVISYIGRLDSQKGIETLIQAFAICLKQNPNLQLLIAGKPLLENQDYQHSLETLSLQFGLQHKIHFLGHIRDAMQLYQMSDLVVLPSTWSEPFGRVIVEAMACGTPVVGSRIGGIPEILSGAFQIGLFEPKNTANLAETIHQVLDWAEQTPHLDRLCREHILNHFSLEHTIKGIEAVLINSIQQSQSVTVSQAS